MKSLLLKVTLTLSVLVGVCDSQNRTFSYSTAGWRWDDNSVYGYWEGGAGSGAGWGLQIPPGCIATNNAVYAQHDTQNHSFTPVYAMGILSSSAGLQECRGAFIDGLFIAAQSGQTARALTFGTDSGTSDYNVIARNLRTTGNDQRRNYTAGDSDSDTFEVLDSTTLTSLTAEEPILYYLPNENFEHY